MVAETGQRRPRTSVRRQWTIASPFLSSLTARDFETCCVLNAAMRHAHIGRWETWVGLWYVLTDNPAWEPFDKTFAERTSSPRVRSCRTCAPGPADGG